MNYNMKHFSPLMCVHLSLRLFLFPLLLINTQISPVWPCEASQITATAHGMSKKWRYTMDAIHTSVKLTGSGERIFSQQRSLVERAIVLLSNCGNIHMVVISGKNSTSVNK